MSVPTGRQICAIKRILVPFVFLAAVSCASLEDGVYLVVPHDRGHVAVSEQDQGRRAVELESLPLKGEAPDTFLVIAEPILRLEEVSSCDFKFDENNECTRVVLKNTEALKAFSRTHVGSRVAIVIGGKVVTSHKIRVPLETDEIEITFCTEGAGDHLYKNLKKALVTRSQ